MKALDSITTLVEVKAYAQAEAADAASQCPAAHGDYQKAIQIADTYMTFAGTALEITYVETVRQAIKQARQTWYAVGCSAPPTIEAATPSGQSSQSVAPTYVEGSVLGGSAGKLLLVGGAVFGLLYLLDKKRKGKGKKSSRPRKRVTRRRRRR